MFRFPAYLAVAGAIACTLWVNGSYAWWLGGDNLFHQVALTVISIVIDLAKCGFLAAARVLWQAKARIPALVLVVLWVPALAFSTFAGFSYLTTTRSAARATDEAAEAARNRAQARYADATDLIARAKASPLWTASAGCTTIKRDHRDFCTRVAAAIADQRAATQPLDALPVIHANPEIATLSGATGFPIATIQLVIALWPAVLIELLASLGAYALQAYPAESPQKPHGGPVEAVSEVGQGLPAPESKNAPTGLPGPRTDGAPATRPLKWGAARPVEAVLP